MNASNPGLEPESNEPRKRPRAQPKISVVPSEAVPQDALVVPPEGDPTVQTEEQALQRLDELTVRLASANDPSSLKSVCDQAAVMREILRRIDTAFDSQNRFAELELRAERKLGQVLAMSLHHGRPKKPYSGCSVSPEEDGQRLPRSITWNRSSSCQRIAAMPDSEFEDYIVERKRQKKLISRKGLLQICKPLTPPKPRKDQPKIRVVEQGDADGDFTDIWDALRSFKPFNVAVGLPAGAVNADLELRPDVADRKKVKGNVVAWVHERVDEWLAGLHEARSRGDVATAVVVFRATTHEPWFGLVDEGGWMCCFLAGQGATEPTIIACCGAHQPEFARKLAPFGAILVGTGHHRK